MSCCTCLGQVTSSGTEVSLISNNCFACATLASVLCTGIDLSQDNAAKPDRLQMGTMSLTHLKMPVKIIY